MRIDGFLMVESFFEVAEIKIPHFVPIAIGAAFRIPNFRPFHKLVCLKLATGI